ncbi:MAG: phosphatase PAP2 family protein [Elusimicrobia bacterium]|nr:phosphatase PAP2 family protein [Elusimicrobiota bacterium]
MTRTKVLRNAVLCILLAAGIAAAKGPQRKQPALYLSEAALQTLQLPPAPVPGSALDKADLIQLHDWEKRRTKQQCAAAQAQEHAYFDEFFGDISPFVKPLPQEAADFLRQVQDDVDVAVGRLKDQNQRPRPYRHDSSLHPCLGRIGGLSYPSGHAALSSVYALMLSELVPARTPEFLTAAGKAALNRVIGGVHHPSDIEAGKLLGDMLYARFSKDPAFQAQIESLRASLAK